MLWIGNATVGASLAMLGVIFSNPKFGYDLHLAFFGMPAGAFMAATGSSLVLFAIWRIRQEQ